MNIPRVSFVLDLVITMIASSIASSVTIATSLIKGRRGKLWALSSGHLGYGEG